MVRRSERASGREQSVDHATLPPGAPSWVTPELVARTLEVWQPYYSDPLTPEDALAMILGVGCLFDLLSRRR
jgi:hypothetical protein